MSGATAAGHEPAATAFVRNDTLRAGWSLEHRRIAVANAAWRDYSTPSAAQPALFRAVRLRPATNPLPRNPHSTRGALFPPLLAGSFPGGFRTPAPVPARPSQWAGIRNPSQGLTFPREERAALAAYPTDFSEQASRAAAGGRRRPGAEDHTEQVAARHDRGGENAAHRSARHARGAYVCTGQVQARNLRGWPQLASGETLWRVGQTIDLAVRVGGEVARRQGGVESSGWERIGTPGLGDGSSSNE